MLTESDKKLITVLVKEVASKMLVEIIDQVFSYNAERREKKPFNGEEVHFRTLELLERYARKVDDGLWMEYDELLTEHSVEFIPDWLAD